MKALVLQSGLPTLIERAIPLPRYGEVRVRTAMVGLCLTDLEVAAGRLAAPEGIALGHEVSGTVVACGEGVSLPVGGRCAILPIIDECFMGLQIDGALQESFCLPAANVVLCPPTLDDRGAAYLEPVAAAMACLKAVRGDGPVAVHGDGRIADLCRLVLETQGIACRQIRAGEARPDDAGRFATVVEASFFSPANVAEAFALVRPEGVICVRSRHAEPLPFPTSVAIAKEVTVRYVRYGDFAAAMDWIGRHCERLPDFWGDTYGLDDWRAAFAAAGRDGSRKTFVRVA